MNLLTNNLSNKIEIDGVFYNVKTDWRLWVKFSQTIMSDESSENKAAVCLSVVNDTLPLSIDPVKLITALLNFMNPPSPFPEKSNKKNIDLIYDFEKDSEFIYSSFRQQYGINLTCENMHWYEFRALFNGLGEDTEFSKILGYRSMTYKQIHSIKDAEQRRFYLRKKAQYTLKDELTNVQKQEDAVTSFASSFI